MPPVNTPSSRSPVRPQTPHAARPLTPLSYLSSPVPDLASTLHTQAADAADEANASFLRDSLESLDQLASNRSSNSRVDAQRDPRRADYQPPPESRMQNSNSARDTSSSTAEDISRRERLQRVLARLNRLHEPSASATAAYSNRTPSPNRQSLYDWAPGSEESSSSQQDELHAILAELQRQQPDTHPDILRVLSQRQLENYMRHRERDRDGNLPSSETADAAERRNRVRMERERRNRENEWVSLRSRAVMQRARQEGGAGSPSATERMLRYVMDRERSGMSEEEERARGSGWFRPSPTRGEGEQQRSDNRTRESWSVPSQSDMLRERERQERVDAFRRGYLAEHVPRGTQPSAHGLPTPSTSSTHELPRIPTPPVASTVSTAHLSSGVPFLENALRYLSELRSCSRYEEALSTAIEHGLATKEFFADKHDDFVMDVDEIAPLPYSSWLQPGAVFEGHQYATSCTANLAHNRHTATSSHVEQINPNFQPSNSADQYTRFDHPPGSTTVTPFDAARPWLSHIPPNGPITTLSSKEATGSNDSWPVRVIIHSINPEKMTLQGTMEAYDVPQHPSSLGIFNSADRPKAGKKNAPITTYLEGHIIDLRTHSFLTPGKEKDRTRRLAPRDNESNRTTRPTYSESAYDNMNFPSASAATDAQNWLKLPPFSHGTSTNSNHSNSSGDSSSNAADVSRILLSMASLQKLNEDYIFMRWKEKCFVHSSHSDPCSAPVSDRTGDQDRGHGLTISGFYYVSLRRSDGRIEGLYFDPASTPFQRLELQGKGGAGLGAWEFK